MRSPICLLLAALSLLLSLSLSHGAGASASASTSASFITTTSSPGHSGIVPSRSVPKTPIATSEIQVQTLELRSDPSAGAADTDPTSSQSGTPTITAFALPSGIASTEELAQKWHVETFWSCVTFAITTHCGWHEPVRPGGDEIAGAGRVGAAGAVVVAGLVMAGFLV